MRASISSSGWNERACICLGKILKVGGGIWQCAATVTIGSCEFIVAAFDIVERYKCVHLCVWKFWFLGILCLNSVMVKEKGTMT